MRLRYTVGFMSRLFRDVDGDLLFPQGSVVCIGAFDGLHLGHAALVRRTVERAQALDLPSVALTFEPLPREWFAREQRQPRLMLSSQRVRSLHQLGIDSVGLLRFNESMTRLTADEFARRILHDRLQAREVWVGPEFAYGHRRGGNLDTLQEQGSRLGFTAHEIEPQHLAGERISSSVIRQQLGAGEFAAAEQLLGRPYRIEGKVVHGAKLGRTLGFPTANIRYSRYQPVLHGIYACWVNLADGRRLPAVASFGTRPTVNGTHHEPLLEVHLFDFEGDLYGQRIGVDFAAKLRDEKKFDSLEALTAQMHRDADEARQVLNSHFTLRATA